jgi:cell division septum initiation protein DivIVA
MSPAGNPKDFNRQQRALRATTAERLEAIVEAAERAAESVIDDAEAQARRYLSQAQAEADRLAENRSAELSGLIETLLGQALALRREAESLQATLEEARGRIEGQGAESAASAEPEEREIEDEPEAPHAPRLRAVVFEEAPAAEEGGKRSDAAGARLLATQMAISGSSREEIAHRLRNGFEIEDTDAILDAILGPEES